MSEKTTCATFEQNNINELPIYTVVNLIAVPFPKATETAENVLKLSSAKINDNS